MTRFADPHRCPDCLTATGTWFIKEGKDTNGNETFARTATASLLGVNDNPDLSNRNRAGGYELKGCSETGEKNLATGGQLDAQSNPVISSFCLPASFQSTDAAGGVASTITELPQGDPNFARQSLICIAKPGANCPASEANEATFDGKFIIFTFKVADAALQAPGQPKYTITQVFHGSSTPLPTCLPNDADNTDPGGCVVSIDPPKGPGIKTWTIVTKAKTNGPWSW